MFSSSGIKHSFFFTILCSGLTEKTKLSFTSSNSSFSDCVRKDACLLSSLSSFNTDYVGSFSTRLPLSTTANFTSCRFTCEGPAGGAIYFYDTSASLSVSQCTFEKCNSTADHGGAIYGIRCGSISISSSLFFKCFALLYSSGGGLFVNQASQVPEIVESSFISCAGGHDAGGLYIYLTTGAATGSNRPVSECRFSSCTAHGIRENPYQNDGDGGALSYWDNTHTLGVSDTLLLSNRATTDGGALFFQMNTDVRQHRIIFCFFHNNYAPLGCDALIHFTDPDDHQYNKVVLQSFTTCTASSLAENNNDPNIIDNPQDWLPQANSIEYLSASESENGENALIIH